MGSTRVCPRLFYWRYRRFNNDIALLLLDKPSSKPVIQLPPYRREPPRPPQPGGATAGSCSTWR